MKNLLLSLLILFACSSFQAQSRIDPNYPYKIVPTENIQNLKNDNYVFKDVFDYINFRKTGSDNVFQEPVFFTDNEIGIILKRTLTSGTSSFKIRSVVETENSIIITTVITTSQYQTADMAERIVFMKIKKTEKEIIFNEE